MKRPRITAQVRTLLVELRTVCERFDAQTRTLASNISTSEAMEVGANREATKAAIIGVAYRINQAANK